jgi:hypothetical protein
VTVAFRLAVVAVLAVLVLAETWILGDPPSRDVIAPTSRETPVEPCGTGHGSAGTEGDR